MKIEVLGVGCAKCSKLYDLVTDPAELNNLIDDPTHAETRCELAARMHAYFDRVAAIEYTLKHDDGQNPQGWSGADILLLGVSRTGKTPLSVYLSILGYKVAQSEQSDAQPVAP